jgi:amino acid transporter
MLILIIILILLIQIASIGSLTSIAATSITWSTYFDSLTNNEIKNFTINVLHASWSWKSPFNNYLDIPACAIAIIFFLICLRGVHLTTLFNNTLAILNIALLICISLGGLIFGKFKNLTSTPYVNGINGIFKGASIVMLVASISKSFCLSTFNSVIIANM